MAGGDLAHPQGAADFTTVNDILWTHFVAKSFAVHVCSAPSSRGS
jgi:hypothetical protein